MKRSGFLMQIQFNLTFIRPWSLLSSKFFQAHSLQFQLASIPLDPDSPFGSGAPYSSLAPFAPVGPGGPLGSSISWHSLVTFRPVTAIPSVTTRYPVHLVCRALHYKKMLASLKKEAWNRYIGARKEKGYLFFKVASWLFFLGGEMMLIWKINKLG